MPTSSQALKILHDVNTTDTPKLWYPSASDDPDVKQEYTSMIYDNGEEVRYGTLAFHKRIPLSYPGTKLGPYEPADGYPPEEYESVDTRRSPLFHEHTLPTAVETFHEVAPPPTSACPSNTDLFRTFPHPSEPQSRDNNISRQAYDFKPPQQNVLQGRNDRGIKPRHRWGTRPVRQSQRLIKTQEPSRKSNLLPDIHTKADNGKPQTLRMVLNDQPSNRCRSNMECPMLTYNELSTTFLTNESWFKDMQKRNRRYKLYWNFRAMLLESLDKSNSKHEDHMRLVALLGTKEKEKVPKIVKKKTAAEETLKTPSLHVHESGDNNAIQWMGENDRIFTGKDKFSILSGNPTSALRRRRATRVNFPSNFMDFTLRFGSGVKLNNIFEAKGRHLKEDDVGRQASKKEVPLPSYPKTVSIAEGVDLQDLLPARKGQLVRLPTTNEISENQNRRNEWVEMPKGTQTTFPNLVKAGIVEHGFCCPEYDPSLQTVTSRIIGVEGSEPGARKNQIIDLKSQRQGVEEVKEYIEQNDDPARGYEKIPMGYLKRNDPFNLQLDDGASSKYLTTDDRFSLIDTSDSDPLHRMVTLGDFSFKSDLQARVREIGLYEETRKRVVATDKNVSVSPTSTSNSGESNDSATSSASPSPLSSTHHSFKRRGKSAQNGLSSGDSSREEFSEQLQNPEPRRGLPKQQHATNNNWRSTNSNTSAEKDSKPSLEDDNGLDTLKDGKSVAKAQGNEGRKKRCINFQGDVILPPSKRAIAQAKTLDAFIEEEVQETLRKFESAGTAWGRIKEGEVEGEADDKEQQSPEEEEVDYWQNEREEQLFKRIKSKVLRMRKVLPPSEPNKLCFVSNIASCSHLEVKEQIESCGTVTVTHLQYDPVYLGEGTPDRYIGLWIFEISKDSDKTNLLLRGIHLKGRPMNVRRLDDVTMEEYRAFEMYHAIRLEQRKKKLNRYSKRR